MQIDNNRLLMETSASKASQSWGIQTGKRLSCGEAVLCSTLRQPGLPNYVKASMMWPLLMYLYAIQIQRGRESKKRRKIDGNASG